MITLKTTLLLLNISFSFLFPVNQYKKIDLPPPPAKPVVQKPKVVTESPKPNIVATNPYTEVGDATWYDYVDLLKRGGKDTSKLDWNRLTAAHKTLPFGTIVLVEPLNNKDYKPIEVVINDRLPRASTRTIDLHKASAIAMNPRFIQKGVLKVKIMAVR